MGKYCVKFVHCHLRQNRLETNKRWVTSIENDNVKGLLFSKS